MAKVLDCVGNEVKKDDRVHVMLSSTSCIATVLSVSGGGLSLVQGVKNASKGQAQMMTPGVVEMLVKVAVPFDPRDPRLPNVVRVVSPEDETPSKVIV